MTLPSADELVASFAFVARRHGVAGVVVNASAVAAALVEARRLVGDELDEPAALFFAFARRPRAVPGVWRVIAPLIARNAAAAGGRQLRASDEELHALRVSLVGPGAPSWSDVHAWFAERLGPR